MEVRVLKIFAEQNMTTSSTTKKYGKLLIDALPARDRRTRGRERTSIGGHRPADEQSGRRSVTRGRPSAANARRPCRRLRTWPTQWANQTRPSPSANYPRTWPQTNRHARHLRLRGHRLQVLNGERRAMSKSEARRTLETIPLTGGHLSKTHQPPNLAAFFILYPHPSSFR